jgi:hypothetical protein
MGLEPTSGFPAPHFHSVADEILSPKVTNSYDNRELGGYAQVSLILCHHTAIRDDL